MPSLQATADFDSSLREADALLVLAASMHGDAVAFSALLKSSILLLTSKLEAFLEGAAEECRFFIENAACSAGILPSAMRVAMLQSFFDDSFLMKLKHGNPQILDRLDALKELFYGGEVQKLVVETKFSYGKHGDSEVRKLFQRFGIKDIFESAYEEDIDAIKADLNSLTAIRNNIIHNDASPSFSVEQVLGFVAKMRDFSSRLDACLYEHCLGITMRKAVASH